jgi:hypothetical protein
MTDGFTQVVDEASGGLISEARRQEQQAQEQAQKQKRKGGTVAESLGPVLDAEKTDIEFWMMVAQTVLLLVIARELRSGG